MNLFASWAVFFDALSEHLTYISLISAVILVAYLGLLLAGRHSRRPLLNTLAGNTIRGSLALGLGIMTVVPLLFVTGILADRTANNRRAEISLGLQKTAADVTSTLDLYLHGVLIEIANAANSLPHDQPLVRGRKLDAWLDTQRGINDDFQSMITATARGDIVSASPTKDFSDRSIVSQAVNIADRLYFQSTLADPRPQVSDVFRGRVYGHDQIIAVSAPLLDAAGRARGVVEGSIDLAFFDKLQQAFPLAAGTEMVVVDGANRVIFSSTPSIWPPLADLSGSPLSRAAFDAGSGSAFRYREVDERQPGRYYLAAYSETARHWRVLLRMPLVLVNDRVYQSLTTTAVGLLLAIAFALLLAVMLARRITEPLGSLSQLMSDYEPVGGGKLEWTPNSPQEITSIYRAFRNTAQRVTVLYGRLTESLENSEKLRKQLDDAVANRERMIEDRTAQLARANRLLDQQAKLDPLTGIANRRGAEEFLGRCWSFGQRDGAPLAVLMVDADYFKAYNDEYGHRAGDECLQSIATALAEAASRPLDMAARWGGEEFLVILGATPTEGALATAERMRRAVEALGIPHSLAVGRSVVTVSIGVATRVPSRDGHVTSLLEEADRALYKAKEQGRNRVVSAQLLTPAHSRDSLV